jgi:cation diffusion facilitator CzcD-associated flavoprotein CzcO
MTAGVNNYEWAIIGAGPAGIAVIGKLLDAQIPPEKIVWIDPQFRVGDFGTLWRNVSSNTKVGLFSRFLNSCKSFAYETQAEQFALSSLDPNHTCQLHFMADPLQWVTDRLQKIVRCEQGFAKKITMQNQHWQIAIENTVLSAKNVVLATGAEAKSLDYPNITTIPLTTAMDDARLKAQLNQNDSVAVFGASHSAMLALRTLVEFPIKQVINFYRSPLRFAVYFDDFILFDNTGLKGDTAIWARKNISDKLPSNLQRYYASSENLQRYLPQCNKAIYAVGFARRNFPVIEDLPTVDHNPQTGIIAPGLFGIGIAFPESKADAYNIVEERVGLWKFMDYLNRVLSLWMRYPI